MGQAQSLDAGSQPEVPKDARTSGLASETQGPPLLSVLSEQNDSVWFSTFLRTSELVADQLLGVEPGSKEQLLLQRVRNRETVLGLLTAPADVAMAPPLVCRIADVIWDAICQQCAVRIAQHMSLKPHASHVAELFASIAAVAMLAEGIASDLTVESPANQRALAVLTALPIVTVDDASMLMVLSAAQSRVPKDVAPHAAGKASPPLAVADEPDAAALAHGASAEAADEAARKSKSGTLTPSGADGQPLASSPSRSPSTEAAHAGSTGNGASAHASDASLATGGGASGASAAGVEAAPFLIDCLLEEYRTRAGASRPPPGSPEAAGTARGTSRQAEQVVTKAPAAPPPAGQAAGVPLRLAKAAEWQAHNLAQNLEDGVKGPNLSSARALASKAADGARRLFHNHSPRGAVLPVSLPPGSASDRPRPRAFRGTHVDFSVPKPAGVTLSSATFFAGRAVDSGWTPSGAPARRKEVSPTRGNSATHFSGKAAPMAPAIGQSSTARQRAPTIGFSPTYFLGKAAEPSPFAISPAGPPRQCKNLVRI